MSRSSSDEVYSRWDKSWYVQVFYNGLLRGNQEGILPKYRLAFLLFQLGVKVKV